jgi:Beta-galactosidase
MAVKAGGRRAARRGIAGLALLSLAAAAPAAPPWPGYQVIYWQADGGRIAGLRQAGATAGRITAFREHLTQQEADQAVAPFLADGVGFYLENIATDFYAPYHRWRPGMAVNQAFLDVQRAFARNPEDPALLERQPSLSDPNWQARIDARLAAHVHTFGRWHPLFYNLGDETGIADLAAPWDFDFSSVSLAAFRTWLRGQYSSLAALNAEWGSSFATWDAVRPMTTAEALHQPDGDLAGWGDFKAFMDLAYASALRAGTDAVHAADPAALAGMEGGQLPGWGGYNYIRLAHVVDVMELYEAAQDLPIVHALNPDLVLLTTSFGSGPAEIWRLWHTALLGVRGAVIWDEPGNFVTNDGQVGPRARTLAPVFTKLRGGVGALLGAAQPVPGPVGMLYSPASLRIAWLRDRIGDAGWETRQLSGDPNAYTAPLRAMDQAAATLDGLGMPARWVTPDELVGGVPAGLRAILLPDSLALSDAAVAALQRFAASGGVVLADGSPGRWDQHLRRRAELPGSGITLLPGFDSTGLAPALARAGISGPALRGADGGAVQGVSLRSYRLGAARLIALQTDRPQTAPMELRLTLDRPAWVRDVQGSAPARQLATVSVTLDPLVPTILALTDVPPEPPLAQAPTLAAGGRLTVALQSPAPVLQLTLLDPSGREMPGYARLVWLHDGHADSLVGFAATDPHGTWTIRVSDPLGGGSTALHVNFN